jgi:hypothetical protein
MVLLYDPSRSVICSLTSIDVQGQGTNCSWESIDRRRLRWHAHADRCARLNKEKGAMSEKFGEQYLGC